MDVQSFGVEFRSEDFRSWVSICSIRGATESPRDSPADHDESEIKSSSPASAAYVLAAKTQDVFRRRLDIAPPNQKLQGCVSSPGRGIAFLCDCGRLALAAVVIPLKLNGQPLPASADCTGVGLAIDQSPRQPSD